MTALELGRRTRRPVNPPLHVAGLALVFVSAGMGASALVELIDGGDEVLELALAAGLSCLAGVVLWKGTEASRDLSIASAFATVAWTWVVISVAGAIPYLTTGTLTQPDAAVFESISGFTTTGASLLPDIQGQGAGILFWRSMTQWFGGMGIVVLAVSVLPLLGVGGLELLRAEAPGPTSDRLSPRIAETAKRLWMVYAALTAATALALGLAGLSPYDAVTHAFATLSTGGFSPYDASVAHFGSAVVEGILIVAMVAAGTSFILHYRAVRGDVTGYRFSAEFRAFAGMLLLTLGAVTALNVADGTAVLTSLRDSAFSVVSVVTTTGFGTADFAAWVPAAQMILLFLMLIGGMTGSTAGGAKVLRLQVLWTYAVREVKRARHPRGVFPLKLGSVAVPETVVGRIAGFLVLYLLIFLGAFATVASLGTDLVTSLSGVAASIGNIGPALGDAGPSSNFLVFSRPARAVLAALMLVGRLEIFPLLLMFAAPQRAIARRRAMRRVGDA